MSSTTLRKKNKNFIVWEPVPATGKPFTSCDPIVAIHEIYAAVAPNSFAEPITHAFAVIGSSTTTQDIQQYNAMLKMAKKSAPAQAWFDEDFTDLRHGR